MLKKTVTIDQSWGILGAGIPEWGIEQTTCRLHYSVSPQPPFTFCTTFLDLLFPLSWSLEQAILSGAAPQLLRLPSSWQIKWHIIFKHKKATWSASLKCVYIIAALHFVQLLNGRLLEIRLWFLSFFHVIGGYYFWRSVCWSDFVWLPKG